VSTLGIWKLAAPMWQCTSILVSFGIWVLYHQWYNCAFIASLHYKSWSSHFLFPWTKAIFKGHRFLSAEWYQNMYVWHQITSVHSYWCTQTFRHVNMASHNLCEWPPHWRSRYLIYTVCPGSVRTNFFKICPAASCVLTLNVTVLFWRLSENGGWPESQHQILF
jgi:hypothetical protein